MATFTLHVSAVEMADEMHHGDAATEVLSALAKLDEECDGDVVSRIVEGFSGSISHGRIIPFLRNVIDALEQENK